MIVIDRLPVARDSDTTLDNPAPMLIGSPFMDTGHRKSWDDIRRDATRFAKDWRLAYDEK